MNLGDPPPAFMPQVLTRPLPWKHVIRPFRGCAGTVGCSAALGTASPAAQPLYALSLVAMVGLASVLATHRPVAVFEVISRSMNPTLARGDRAIALSWALFARSPASGDLVTFRLPQWAVTDPPVVKRVVATGGDRVEIHDGALFVNARRMVEPYAPAYAPEFRYGPLQLPSGTVFVLGDNRRLSEDSTSFGPVPVARLDSLVWLRLAPGKPVCSLAGAFPGLDEC